MMIKCEAATPRSVEVVRVIKVVALRGAGTDESPAREVTQWWDFEGNMVGEHDPQQALETR